MMVETTPKSTCQENSSCKGGMEWTNWNCSLGRLPYTNKDEKGFEEKMNLDFPGQGAKALSIGLILLPHQHQGEHTSTSN